MSKISISADIHVHNLDDIRLTEWEAEYGIYYTVSIGRVTLYFQDKESLLEFCDIASGQDGSRLDFATASK